MGSLEPFLTLKSPSPPREHAKLGTYVYLLVGQSVNFMRERARASIGTSLTVWWRYEMRHIF